MNEVYKFLGYFLMGFVLCYFLMNSSCEGNNDDEPATKVKVEVPEISGSIINDEKPKHNPVKLTKPQIVYKTQTDTVYSENQINIEYFNRYMAAKDSVAKMRVAMQAFTIRDYSKEMENDYLRLNVSGKVMGEVQELNIASFLIKKREADADIKTVKFRMLGAVEIGNTPQFDNFNAKASIMMQNKSGDIFSIGAGTNDMYYAGFAKKIFEVKK